MKKLGLVLSIIGVVAVVAIATLAVLEGSSDMGGLAYVKVSVNPQVEFVCDGSTVVGCNAINEEAKELCAQENFTNSDIESACSKFVDLCAQAGYINVNGEDNAIKIDCVANFAQSLEVKVYNAINNYLKEKQIVGGIIENNNDNAAVLDAKKAGVSVDKLALIRSYLNLNSNANFEEVKEISKSNLIEKIKTAIENLGDPSTTYTEEQLTNKRVLIDLNRVNYAKHLENATPETQSAFNQLLSEKQSEIRNSVKSDFGSAYQIWKTNHINFVG
jgi:hypothetical protein